MKRVQVTFVGEEVYGSTDPHDGGRSVILKHGESAYVSEPKAAQLEADFAHWFEFGETVGEDDPTANDVDDAAKAAEAERIRLEAEAKPAADAKPADGENPPAADENPPAGDGEPKTEEPKTEEPKTESQAQARKRGRRGRLR